MGDSSPRLSSVEAILRDPVILDALRRLRPLVEALAAAEEQAKPRRRRPSPPPLPPRPEMSDTERAAIGATLRRRGLREP